MSGSRSDAKRPRILLVDDDATIRVIAQDHLEAAGFQVVTASRGGQVLTRFVEERPDLLLLDLQMPELDGLSICEQVRSRSEGEHVPIVVMTSLDDVEWVRRAYEAGATDFVTKPVDWLVVTERLRYMLRAVALHRELRRREARLERIQRIAHLGSWEFDLEAGALHASSEVRLLYGLETSSETLSPQALLDRIHAEDRPEVQHAVGRSLRKGAPLAIDHRVVLPDGETRVVRAQGEACLGEGGRVVELAGTAQDVTEQKRVEERIRFLAYHDSLTQLPNRRLFSELLRQSLAQARRRGRRLAVLFLDLDHLKRINDSLGHSVGDELLQRVADRLRSCTREEDMVSRVPTRDASPTISRFGGDEFLVVLNEINVSEDAGRVAGRILEVLCRPFAVKGHELVVGASIGIAIHPSDGTDVETLLSSADAAMYHAKDSGRNNYQFYEQSMNEAALRRLQLEGELRKAIEGDQLHVHYQPKLELGSARISGAEALLRWTHPRLGRVSPGEFVPVAEQGGLIHSIGRFVMRAACAQAKAWLDHGVGPVRVSVNLSAHQFAGDGIVDTVRSVLEETGLPPRWLELEITESVLMENEQLAVGALKELRQEGIRVSLDDFGTGYSSLSYLKRFPVDTVKIDRSFVRDITTEPEDAAIIGASISIARALDMKVIAEGVETPEQRQFLQERGCDEIQGYLYSPPVDAESLAELLRRDGTTDSA